MPFYISHLQAHTHHPLYPSTRWDIAQVSWTGRGHFRGMGPGPGSWGALCIPVAVDVARRQGIPATSSQPLSAPPAAILPPSSPCMDLRRLLSVPGKGSDTVRPLASCSLLPAPSVPHFPIRSPHPGQPGAALPPRGTAHRAALGPLGSQQVPRSRPARLCAPLSPRFWEFPLPLLPGRPHQSQLLGSREGRSQI